MRMFAVGLTQLGLVIPVVWHAWLFYAQVFLKRAFSSRFMLDTSIYLH
jgi:hypothetical protein